VISLLARLRPYGRIFFIIIWMALLFLIATNIQAGWLYVVISFLGLLCFYSVIIPVIALRAVRVSIELPELCERGTPTSGTIFIENSSRYPRFMIRAEPVSESLRFEPSGVFVIVLPGGGRAACDLRFTPGRRGRIVVREALLTCGAPAGVYQHRRRVSVTARTLVHPRISASEGEHLAGMGDESAAVKREKFYAIEDPYHYKLREYAPGDSLSRLHWKLTAKRGKPIIRIHERRIFGHSGILVENRRDRYPPGAEEDFERNLERAISLAYHLVFIRGSSVTVSGTAAPEIALDSPDVWHLALKWFAMIRLEALPRGGAYEEPGEADFTFDSGPGSPGAETEEARVT